MTQITWESNMSEFLQGLRRTLNEFERRARENLDNTGRRIFEETQAEVPVSTGALKASGKVESIRLPDEHVVQFRWGGEGRAGESVEWTIERDGDRAWWDQLPLRDEEWMEALRQAWREST